LCGEPRAQLEGRAVDAKLAGRQGRLLFSFLVRNRERPVRRDELLDVLWPDALPPDPDAALRTRLSKLRGALGPGIIEGTATLALRLPPGTRVDVEEAIGALHRAERALAGRDWSTARAAAAQSSEIAGRGFCLGIEVPWVHQGRQELEEVRLRALECLAEAGLGLGGADLGQALDAARVVVATAPFRENGCRLLMTALARRGAVAEALGVYEELRRALRDELGTAPSAELTDLHERLLRGGVMAQEPETGWLLVSPGTNREWIVQVSELLLVGRDCTRIDPSRRLVLDDPTVSREHLELRRDDSRQVVLVDLSTNGTRINGRRVDPGEPTALHDRDLIELGTVKLLYRAPGNLGPAHPTTLRA
jgi:DNA-binding SARP family transcriptional activator